MNLDINQQCTSITHGQADCWLRDSRCGLIKFAMIPWKNSRERPLENDTFPTHKQGLFSRLHPSLPAERPRPKEPANWWGKGARSHSAQPWGGTISPRSRKVEIPTANSVFSSGTSFPGLQQSSPSHQLHTKGRSREKAFVILHPQFPALLILFVLKQMWETSQSSEQHTLLRSSEPFSRFR